MTERLYPADSFLTQFDAVVMEVQELSRSGGRSLWRLALDRSAFYPTGGGQPHDTGRLIARARSGAELAAGIVDVEEDEQGEVWHHTEKPLSAGTAVRGFVDVSRRLDHIQQHSGQHLLSAAFFQLAQAPTISFHLGEKLSTIDLAAEPPSRAILDQVEELANRIIAEDRPVVVSTVSRAQAEQWLACGRMRKLPPRAGDLRIVEIAGDFPDLPFDCNACGGTHVRSTGQIGGLHLRSMEKAREGWRIEFVCGLRAMQAARQDFATLTEAGRNLSVAPAEVPAAIGRLQAELKDSGKRLQAQAAELSRLHAAELIRYTPIENGRRFVQLQWSSASGSIQQAKQLAGQIAAQAQSTVAIITARPTDPAQPATIIFSRSGDLPLDCGAMLRQALSAAGGRGGGSAEMAQGSVPVAALDVVVAELARGITDSPSSAER